MRPGLSVLVATGFLLATAGAAETPAAAQRARELAASFAAANVGRVLSPADVAEAAALARQVPDDEARRLVFVVPQTVLDLERAAWSELARQLRSRGTRLQIYGVGDDGAASSITWAGERSPLLAPALAASPLSDELGTGFAWEPSVAAAFERAAREDRLVLLVQLSGRFDAIPET